tara:strand:- start:5119 stop:6366 length:1248 start_codon:yes stop_codon:yes gene_type:complete
LEKKIILVANGPLLTKQTLKMNAYSLRTIQFIEGLKDLNPKVILLDSKDNYKNKKFPKIKGVSFYEKFSEIKKVVKKHRPEFLISVNNYTSYLCSKIPGSFYRICDLNGTLPYELQAQCSVEKNDFRFRLINQRQKRIIKKADLITTVSNPQKNSVIGQQSLLGSCGYMNLGKKLVSVVENSQVSKFDDCYNNEKFSMDIPVNSQKVLFLGSFNNWVDEITLIKSFAYAKRKNPNLVLLLTGKKENIFGNKKYENFRKLAEEDNLKDSIFHLGFIDYLDMKSLIEFCDLGIVCDLDIYESQLGARNRINEMMKFKLPVICTKNSQISKIIYDLNSNLVAKSGDYKDIAKKINWALDKENKKQINLTLKSFNSIYLDNQNLLQPIKDFIKDPFKKSKLKIHPLKFIIKKLIKTFNL